MNIFKKIGSFASNSWKDFSEIYDQQPLNEAESVDSKLSTESSFELKKRNDEEIERKKSTQGFFRKRFSMKKKLLMDDPRSPTTQFQRTPIVLAENAHVQSDMGILSPFNVQDMLASIDTAIVTDTPKKVAAPESSIENNIMNQEPENLTVLEDDFVANIGDWNDFKFNEKVLTESLIVEVSTLDINSDLAHSNDSSLVEERSQVFQSDPDSDDMQQHLLQDEEKSSNCKVVGCIVKSDIASENQTAQSKPEADCFVATSTPKKIASSAKLANDKKVPRTPLVSIRNSPMVNKNLVQNPLSNSKPKSEKPKKKKINSTCSRQLPKAPATPLTPLFKNTNKCVSHFDKENF